MYKLEHIFSLEASTELHRARRARGARGARGAW